MAFGNKSTFVSVNTSSQAVAAAGTTLNAGNRCFSSGSAFSLGANGITICDNYTGLYKAGASVTFEPDAAGTVTFQLYKNGVALPCSLRQWTVAADTIYTFDTEAPAFSAASCAMIQTEITAVLSGVAGSVSWFSENVIKQA